MPITLREMDVGHLAVDLAADSVGDVVAQALSDFLRPPLQAA